MNARRSTGGPKHDLLPFRLPLRLLLRLPPPIFIHLEEDMEQVEPMKRLKAQCWMILLSVFFLLGKREMLRILERCSGRMLPRSSIRKEKHKRRHSASRAPTRTSGEFRSRKPAEMEEKGGRRRRQWGRRWNFFLGTRKKC